MITYTTHERDKKFLAEWVLSHSESFNAADTPVSALYNEVTILAYFFRPPDNALQEFKIIKSSIIQTWRHCGFLKTVIVTNALSSCIARFAEEFNNFISIQIEPALVPGNIDCLSIDCNAKLYTRFSTPYLLTVQDDAFPLRAGLEHFVGKFDFIGAPWRRCNVYGQLAGKILHTWPMNGGFSLRSHRFCELVSRYWHKEYANRPFCRQTMAEDTFCTKTLPQKHFLFAHSLKWPTACQAAQFSYDASIPENKLPSSFGFHGTKAFYELMH